MGNQLLRQFGCLNPTKRKKNSTVSSIQSLASVLQPKVSETGVVDERKIFQVDPDLPSYDAKERIEVFWGKSLHYSHLLVISGIKLFQL